MDKDNTHPVKKETLEFIFEYTKNAPEAQLKDVEALDNKVIQILSISSVIVGLISFAVSKKSMDISALIALGIALFAYVSLAVSAFIHLKGKIFQRSAQADQLWLNYRNEDVEEIKLTLVDNIAKAYAHNKEMIRQKSRTLLFVVTFASIEVVAVGVFLILAFL